MDDRKELNTIMSEGLTNNPFWQFLQAETKEESKNAYYKLITKEDNDNE